MSEGRIILIEGTDGTGKTTLANELARVSGSRTAVFHAGPPQNKAYLNEYILPLAIATDGWTCICDRWHLGEPVWSDVFKRKSILTNEQLHIVEKRIQAFGVPVTCIYLTRDEAEILAELDSRDESAKPALDALELYEKARKYSMFYWDEMTLPKALLELQGDADGA